jgi:hypothetical protein
VAAAAGRTDGRLASRIASVSRLTEDEVAALFPKPADVERLKQLLMIVKSAGQENEKTRLLMGRMDQLGGVVVRLLGRLI